MGKAEAPAWAKAKRAQMIEVDDADPVDVKAVLASGVEDVIEVALCDPNPWNPNRVSPAGMKKLAKGIQELYNTVGKIPPITVRPHPSAPGRYQIIDGEHRWRVFKSEKIADKINATIIQVPDGLARRLTLNLNYLRGEPDEKREAAVLSDLIKEGWTPQTLAETLYLEEDEISDRLVAYGESDALSMLFEEERKEEERKEKSKDQETDIADDVFVDLKFKVSVSQAKVIEEELARISSMLKGKNARGRALEYMAVQSSQCDLPRD